MKKSIKKVSQISIPADALVDNLIPSSLAELYGLKLCTAIFAGVDDCPCFSALYYYNPYWL